MPFINGSSSSGHVYERDIWLNFVCSNCGRVTKLRERSVRGMYIVKLLPCLMCGESIYFRAIKVQDL